MCGWSDTPLDVMSDQDIDHLADQEARRFQEQAPYEQCCLTPGDIRTIFIRVFRQNLCIWENAHE